MSMENNKIDIDFETKEDDKYKAIIKYLLNATYPPNYTKNQKRSVRLSVQQGQYELAGKLFSRPTVLLFLLGPSLGQGIN